jgi:hypothetical protein
VIEKKQVKRGQRGDPSYYEYATPAPMDASRLKSQLEDSDDMLRSLLFAQVSPTLTVRGRDCLVASGRDEQLKLCMLDLGCHTQQGCKLRWVCTSKFSCCRCHCHRCWCQQGGQDGNGAGPSGAGTSAQVPTIRTTTTRGSEGSTRGRGSGGGAGVRATSLTRLVAKYHKHEDMLPEDPLQVTAAASPVSRPGHGHGSLTRPSQSYAHESMPQVLHVAAWQFTLPPTHSSPAHRK